MCGMAPNPNLAPPPPTRQFPSMSAAGFLSPASLASWHMDVPPLLEMCRSSTAALWVREQLAAPAKDWRIPGAAWREGGGE